MCPSVTLQSICFAQDQRSSFLNHSKNNHLHCYIISKSDNNNSNKKQDLNARRNQITKSDFNFYQKKKWAKQGK